ncbi:MAG: hypothetical protein MUF55_10615 [Hydrogenophaga sp.]|jgi:hypothetical protein|nr:hypothetical protein [Hydrogenophaga sp.]
MIVMLPLRGWMGDAMALSMAVGHTGNTHQVAVSVVTPPCHMTLAEAAPHAHQADGMHDPQAGAGHGHLLCDLCNGPALNGHWLWAPATSHPPQLLPPGSERFASQTARRNVRPPIS